MKTTIAALILTLVPCLSFAAPVGHAICEDAGKKFQFVFGTYAIGGDDGTLTADGRDYRISAQPGEGFGDLSAKLEVFCLCEAPKGTKIADVKWDVTAGDQNEPQSIHMTINRNGRVTEVDMTCKDQDYKQGGEQN